MIVIGTGLVESYFAKHTGHKGIKAARSQYEAWINIVSRAQWRNPEDLKASYPKASILKAGRVVFRATTTDWLRPSNIGPEPLRSGSSAPIASTIK
jgi:mRNA interferase HigB